MSKHDKNTYFFNKNGTRVDVRYNNIDSAIKIFKRKVNQEGVLRDLRKHEFYERPGEIKRRKRSESINRNRKLKSS